jgi:cysteinyl-tRNA synthetase
MLKLYNTLSRKKEPFKPLKKSKVGIYSCGPTVYWNQHIGNMYAYIQWDAMIRFLKYQNYKVKWVMNITDVGHLTSDEDTGEDKMEKGAKREGISVKEIADKYIKQFLESVDLLNIQRPTVLCKATDHINEQINLIKKIEKNGFAYKTKTGLVFDTSKFPDYTKFAKLKLDKQQAGKRVEIDPEKKNPWDFLLWITNQPNHIMKWDSPWGTGFPGWHIECTAMSTRYLGKEFDIHTGGTEHISVHHTNEIAQAYGAFGKQTAKYWLHNQWLLIDNIKVSKSLGNIILVQDFVKKNIDPLAFRYLVLTSHYRQGLNFTPKALEASEIALDSLREKLLEFKKDKNKIKNIKPYKDKFIKLIENDLNFAQGLAFLWKIIKDKKLSNKEKYTLIIDFDKVLGLNLSKIKETEISKNIEDLIKEREKYRKEKNWTKADEIRKEIEKQGFKIEDTKKGVKIKPESFLTE